MQKFSELGVKPTEIKDIFQVPIIHVCELINQEVKILDFASGVKTPYGENRYVIKIEFEEKERKFFTNSSKIKDVLNQISKENFPFLTTIKQERFNKGQTYYFS